MMHRAPKPIAVGTAVPLRSAFSMVELVVVTAIIALLLAVSIPALVKARQAAARTRCTSNLRNVAFALIHFDHSRRRLPASGLYFHPQAQLAQPYHSWAVSILPFLDQANLYEQWDLERPITDPLNRPLTQAHVAVYVCPMDLSRNKKKQGDLSYAVNGGWGFTIRTPSEVGDCPTDRHGRYLDLNGDGRACTGDKAADNQDRKLFEKLGLFFLENWKLGETVRHHSLDDVHDGASQTFLVTENVRAGYDPEDSRASFADPNPYRSAFYVGNPCLNGRCSEGSIDFSRCNAAEDRINGGLWQPEGLSPAPNSFHPGGVNMAYADGRVSFLSELIDGAVYVALFSPQGLHLDETPLAQVIVFAGF